MVRDHRRRLPADRRARPAPRPASGRRRRGQGLRRRLPAHRPHDRPRQWRCRRGDMDRRLPPAGAACSSTCSRRNCSASKRPTPAATLVGAGCGSFLVRELAQRLRRRHVPFADLVGAPPLAARLGRRLRAGRCGRLPGCGIGSTNGIDRGQARRQPPPRPAAAAMAAAARGMRTRPGSDRAGRRRLRRPGAGASGALAVSTTSARTTWRCSR